MRSIALFNNKGGVGKTTLAYHLGFMFAELGHRVLLADLDPQANLSTMCLTEERLEAIAALTPRPTIYGAVEQLYRGIGDVATLAPEGVSGRIALFPGDLQLSQIEGDLAQAWVQCSTGSERAYRWSTALSRVVAELGTRVGAQLVILDLAPNLGAINRAALLAADHVIVPVAPDLVSLQGLTGIGPQLRQWRDEWRERCDHAPPLGFALPRWRAEPLGYVVARVTTLAGSALPTVARRIERLSATYRESFGIERPDGADIDDDLFCLAQLKDYRSLVPMAQEARKPMFLLKPGDGAIGAHQRAVREAYEDFHRLASRIIERIGGALDPLDEGSA